MLKLLLFAALLASLPALAAPFVTVRCNPPLGAVVITRETATSTSCSGGGSQVSGLGFANASGQVALELARDASAFSSLTTTVSSDIQQARDPLPGSTIGPGGFASVDINYSTELQTAGIQRLGYIQLAYAYANFPFYDGSAQISVGIPISGTSVQTIVGCVTSYTNTCGPGLTYYQRQGLIAVELGSTLELRSLARLANTAVAFDGHSGGSLSTTYQFRFFESDMTTPVSAFSAVSQTPEPASIFFVGAPIVLFGMSRLAGQLHKGKLGD